MVASRRLQPLKPREYSSYSMSYLCDAFTAYIDSGPAPSHSEQGFHVIPFFPFSLGWRARSLSNTTQGLALLQGECESHPGPYRGSRGVNKG
jgi:hypothetical protein